MAEPRAMLALVKRWLLLVLLAACAWPAQAARITDDRGVTFDLARPPQRIVTILPSLAEIVCELGACGRLAGVDDYADWPAAVQRLPRVGGAEDANIERIVALRPDIVLLPATSGAIARLEQLGLRVFGVELKTMADVRRTLSKVGSLLGTPGADAIWERISGGVAQAALAMPPALRGTTVYFEVAAGPYAASESSHIGELLQRLGMANVVPGRLGSVPKLNPEFVVRADPQVIIIPAGEARPLADRPGWRGIRAVRQGRVCALTPAQSDIVVRPGPRMAEAARILAGCIAARAPQQGKS